MTFAALASVLIVHLWLYGGATAEWAFIGRIASPLYAPLIAFILYCMVRYDTVWSRPWSHPVAVWGGQASYSIYLPHETFPSLWKRSGIEAANAGPAWALWTFSLILLLFASRLSYRVIEVPARGAIRHWLDVA